MEGRIEVGVFIIISDEVFMMCFGYRGLDPGNVSIHGNKDFQVKDLE